ncbi:ADP-ribose pyrophosphatase [Parafrankia colletiae]|uniref:ADP-ribose pyrophosphatase n=1 Tax=Parafrankia colletiae TaxID=573497 RepID=A0A1S1QIM2_9ACTN|nr:NUDIX hydrolase [Parafrankia colletiae]MCK9901511.1 NUDIX hydrolase [Frankia sp. Cpl3]OHV33456.1 ADP-ribose pyrophosphatase [Parafrankia colletiae]
MAGGLPITTRSSRVAYTNRWMTVREDVIVRPDGSEGVFGVVEKPDFALVIPVDVEGVWLVEQYRYPVGGRYWEFPQGSWEDDPDVDPAALARAELVEETGLRAGLLHPLGRLFTAYGYANQGCQVFVATDLSAGAPAPSTEEQDLVARRFSHRAWAGMLAGGVIRDAATLAAWALLCANPPQACAFLADRSP